MENQEQENQEVEQTEVEAPAQSEVAEESKESLEELKQRLENARMENLRKTQEIQKLREEIVFKPQGNKSQDDPNAILETWKDHELKALMRDPSQAALHDRAEEIIAKRRFQRLEDERAEKQLHLNTELERQKLYPDTFDPTHPMSVRMQEIMIQNRLNNTPSGRLVAAKLAHMEELQKKSVEAGRKIEKNRQADVNANSSSGSIRPAPRVSDKSKLDELKKRAMEGDSEAKAEWFKLRGII